jgi:hypothetical protein
MVFTLGPAAEGFFFGGEGGRRAGWRNDNREGTSSEGPRWHQLAGVFFLPGQPTIGTGINSEWLLYPPAWSAGGFFLAGGVVWPRDARTPGAGAGAVGAVRHVEFTRRRPHATSDNGCWVDYPVLGRLRGC